MIKKKCYRKNIVAISAGLLFASINLIAQSAPQDDISTINSYLEKRNPPINARSIVSTPIPGIYEVYAGGTIFYIDKTGPYIINKDGKQTRRNISHGNFSCNWNYSIYF